MFKNEHLFDVVIIADQKEVVKRVLKNLYNLLITNYKYIQAAHFVPRETKKRRKNEKNEKNTPKNEKSFKKAIDKDKSCVIIAKYEKYVTI
ncbi:MAG: hypothetical protein IKZ23_00375 [Clostridia bacterium]|nr:hypothetical protein [Clostridia bacterium]